MYYIAKSVNYFSGYLYNPRIMFYGNYCLSRSVLSPLLFCENNLDSPCICIFIYKCWTVSIMRTGCTWTSWIFSVLLIQNKIYSYFEILKFFTHWIKLHRIHIEPILRQIICFSNFWTFHIDVIGKWAKLFAVQWIVIFRMGSYRTLYIAFQCYVVHKDVLLYWNCEYVQIQIPNIKWYIMQFLCLRCCLL